MTDNTAVDGDEEEWGLMPYDPVWTASQAQVSLTYDNGKYGAYVSLLADDWVGNIENGFNNVYVQHAFVWRSFFDNKFKASIGKLYGVNYQTRERIWKTEGVSNGGWDFSESNAYLAARFEFKPIEGLNVGVQWNFLPYGQSTRVSGLPDLAESMKEVGLAAEYKSDLFNIVGGIRFDGADGIVKYDTYTYLKDYYGEWGYVGNAIQNDLIIDMSQYGGASPHGRLAPHWKHYEEVYGKVDKPNNFSTANADKPFDGSTRAIFGFNFKGVKNLTAKMQASFWNLGDFERFGTGSIDETIGYAFTPKFNASVNFFQDFYGGDAFPDNMVNSPYFRFEPNVSYQLTNNINASFLFTYGICNDVVESDWRIKPALSFTLGGFGAMTTQLYYELNGITYTDKAVQGAQANYIPKMMQAKGGEAIYKHNLGLSVMWMF
jgi:hypothetical protein